MAAPICATSLAEPSRPGHQRGVCRLAGTAKVGDGAAATVRRAAPSLSASSSLLKNPSPRRELGDSLYRLESGETSMRGRFVDHGGLFSYITPDKRVPANHPLRKIRKLVRVKA
jgi:hypothetical protein